MKIIEPYVELAQELNAQQIMEHIERAGRVCYKSEACISPKSAEHLITKIIKSGHESVLEHASITFKIICDRGVSHEIVRHRIGVAYSQESTRYNNYGSSKFGGELTFIKPCFWNDFDTNFELWTQACKLIEIIYLQMIKEGAKPEQARSILPNSLKTELFMTANLRAWRHFLKLRCSEAAHPQMRQVAFMILDVLKSKLPLIFEDFNNDK